jgi:hypothetical protein
VKHNLLFVALVLPLVFSACASEDLVTLEGKVRHRRAYPDAGPHYPIIVTPDNKAYNIFPPEEVERILNTRGLTGGCLMRFKVRLLKEKHGYGWQYIEGTVTPISWEILDPLTGKVIKNHRLRRSRWSR